MWKLCGGIFLGWGQGSNDFANIFGTSVSAGLVRYRTAVLLCSFFLLLGACLEGPKCMATVGKFTELSVTTAFICTLSSAIVIAILTYLALPASASQAIIGALLGVAMVSGSTNFIKLYWIFLCWILSPIGSLVFSIYLYKFLGSFFERFSRNFYWHGVWLTVGVLVAGCYGAYSLGANNVANVTGAYAGAGLLSPLTAALIGGLSMVSGVLTYGYKVMETVGKKIVPLDAFSAFVATLANALTLHLFTQVGVPVSATQTIVGAVIGVGLSRDYRTVSKKIVAMIGMGWIITPLSSGLFTYFVLKIFF